MRALMAHGRLAAGGRHEIAATLLDALHESLPGTFAFVRLNDSNGAGPVEAMRAAASWSGTLQAGDLGSVLTGALGNASSKWPANGRAVIEDVDFHLASARLGRKGEFGCCVVGSPRWGFPADVERLALDVCASGATLGLQRARLAEVAATGNERETRLIVDSIPGLIAVLKPSGEVDIANNTLLEYTGRSLEEIKGWGTSDIVHPEDMPHVMQLFMQALASGEPYEWEMRTRRFDGVYQWFHLRGFPVRDGRGCITHWYVLMTQIDDLKRAQDAIRASERNLRLIIDTMPALAWSARPDG
ncbi:MAG TPA: PAS domain-containing protein, partial [Usitatibacter sp.]|nr:PAS domain-containing protein [Usitatibacter sp.]